MEFSEQEIEGLAPDESSIRSGRGLAKPSSWQEVGEEGGFLWGLCKGSGSKPYQVRVDVSQQEVGFKCSCPSRKIPCKHVLGLLFLRARNGKELGGSCPDWVREWREKRERRQAASANQPAAGEDAPKKSRKKSASFAERVEAHLPLMTEGMELLCERMIDAVRHGVTSGWLKGLSRRLVDTQLPGLALMIGKMEQAYEGCKDEASLERLVARMGRLQLLVEAFRGRDGLSEAERYDLFFALGMTMDKEQVLAEGERLGGVWRVLGVAMEEFGRIRERRVWLGNAEGTTALIQDYAPQNAGFPGMVNAGDTFTGEVAFYPGTVRQRALTTENFTPAPEMELPVVDTAFAVRRVREQMAANPWLWRWPLHLSAVRLHCDEKGKFEVFLADGRQLPLWVSCDERMAWALHALTLAAPVHCFGEWTGSGFLPLRAWREGALPWVREYPVDTFL